MYYVSARAHIWMHGYEGHNLWHTVYRVCVCVEVCGLHSQKYEDNNFFACFISKLDSSHVKIKALTLKERYHPELRKIKSLKCEL